MKKEWFADWFDTKYYHILYKNRDFSEAEKFVQNLVNYLSVPAESKVLDLACGKGRHAIFLNQLGFNVVGVDLSAESIAKANNTSKQNLFFETHDMRKVYKENEFDYVFNLFTSFGYFDDERENQQAVDAMYSNIKPGGTLVLDFMNAKKVIANLIPKEVKEVDSVTFNIDRAVENGFIKKHINFSDEGIDYKYKESVKALYQPDFENYFKKSGFKIKAIFGDYHLNKFDENKSDRLIFVCEK